MISLGHEQQSNVALPVVVCFSPGTLAEQTLGPPPPCYHRFRPAEIGRYSEKSTCKYSYQDYIL